MGLIVQKYGGTSVRDAERVMNVANRVAEAYGSFCSAACRSQ